jgi:hypothetical protein
MALSLIDRNSSVVEQWLAGPDGDGPPTNKGGSISTSLDDRVILGDPAFQSNNPNIIYHGRFTNRLSYDPGFDEIIWTNGETRVAPSSSSQTEIDANFHRYSDWEEGGNFETIKNAIITNARIDANSLDPALGPIAVKGYSQFQWVLSGQCHGFTYDHNTGILYGVYDRRVGIQKRTNTEYDQDYGNVKFSRLFGNAGGTSIQRYFVEPIGEHLDTEASRLTTDFLLFAIAAAKPWPIKPDQGKFVASPVLFDDVGIVAFGFGKFGGFMMVNTRGEPPVWLSSHPVEMTSVYAMMPMGIDRFMTVQTIGAGGLIGAGSQDHPLLAVSWRLNRTNNRIEIDDISRIPTQYKYVYPDHVGFMTFDTNRQALILMSPSMETFERHVNSVLCHPLTPNIVNKVVPLEPVHAGQMVKFATATYSDAMPVGAPFIGLSYGGSASATNFTAADAGFRTGGTKGTGNFNIGLTSAACGANFTITAEFSGFSTLLCATLTDGEKFGADPISLSSVSAAFLVSATLSAASPTTVNTAATILAKRPIKDNDAGGGTPRELDHPLSGSYPSPLVYELNPQVWTGHIDEALTKPLYASTRTLEKTATVQYTKDLTDIEIRETWMGGANRIAMGLAQFTSIFDYFNNPPDLQSDGFIIWRPRDVSSKEYNVAMVNLTVGGSPNFVIDHLARQGDGWIHETVELTMRIIGEVE